MRAEVLHGDCLAVMREMPDASVDAVVTDPPYGLAFMGKEWDHGVPGVPFWTEALRVAKPGAALLAFGGTRTFHRLACAVEDAGWRIFDCLSWMYGQGFPKHRTHLKPAWEPIVFAAKKGARFVNVEGCRIGWRGPCDAAAAAVGFADSRAKGTAKQSVSIGKESRDGTNRYFPDTLPGRWPANVVLDEEAAAMLDEQSGERGGGFGTKGSGGADGWGGWAKPSASIVGLTVGFGDSGGASRFFYTAKASRSDREDGNHHPTVKPTDLMRWLCRLVTPPGGTVLDPFCGSGSTGVAANAEGFDFIGIEREAEYVEIARQRIANVAPLFQGGAA